MFIKPVTLFLLLNGCLILTLNAQEATFKLRGNFIQGGLVFGEVNPTTRVKLDQQWVRVSATGKFVLGFGRDNAEQAKLELHLHDNSVETHLLTVKLRKYKIQRIDGLPNKSVNPSKSALQRIKAESADIAQARNLDDDRMDFDTDFVWPSEGPISGVYGSQRILNGQPRQPHYGIDIAVPTGTPVLAPAAGVVTYANDDMYFSGGTLVVDHGHSLSSSFLHLDKILVKVGDAIEKGDKIALVGATGRVTGAHLDWRMNWRDQRIDPGLLMGVKP